MFGGLFFTREREQPQSQGVSKQFLDSLPTKKPTETPWDCHICLEEVKDEKLSAELACGHAFDRDCLSQWLKDHHNCPVCRKELPVDPAAQANASPQQRQQQNFPNGINIAQFFV
jgi:hypothetical protein